MTRLVYVAAVLGCAVATAQAQPTTSPSAVPAAPATPAAPAVPAAPAKGIPAIGDSLPLNGNASWGKLDWLYDVPSFSDAAGKVTLHWFCAPKIQACIDDLARVVTLKEAGRVYVVAYINGTKAQAQKLDPIRESEGVGRGTVAYGRNATKLMKDLGVTGPASIVVDVDGKVTAVTISATPSDLDGRDAKVNAALGAIKEYAASSQGPSAAVKAGERFQLGMTIKLASWLKYSDKSPNELKITAPPDIKCETTSLKGDQIKIADRQLTASTTCSGPKGIYEARGELRFSYDSPGGGTGLGAESTKWKFEIK